MTAAATTATAAAAPRRRSARAAALASLSRFRYRASEDEDEDGAGGGAEESSGDGDYGADGVQDDNSSLSGLSFHSDIEDAVAPPRRRAATRAAAGTVTGKRRRAATTTTTATTLTERPLPKKRAAVKKEEDDSDPVAAKTPARAAPRKMRKPARVVVGGGGGGTGTKKEDDGDDDETATRVEPPTDWERVYDLVKAMRQPGGPAANAAVDTMGCERLAQASASARDRRFHTLVALMLSSQTKDTVNAVVMARLQAELPPHKPGAPPGLNLENMLAVDPAELNRLIWQVGFHNNKTRYLQQAAALLRDQWGGDIPDTAADLMALPGVGPKMAYLCLAAEHGWNRVEGIGVDVHVHRLTNLWGWQKPGSAAARTPEGTRLALQSWLPRDKWKEINWLLVGFGQTVCPPQAPRCGDCTLGLRGLCRAADRKKVAEGRRRRRERGEPEDG